MSELMIILPEVFIYLAIGYVFNYIFMSVAFKDRERDIENKLLSSFVIGYIYCLIAGLLPYKIHNLLLLTSSVVISYLLARAFRSEIVRNVLFRFGVNETGNNCFWDDITDWDLPQKVKVFMNGGYVEGVSYLYESGTNNPHLIIAAYKVVDENGKIIEDYSCDDSKITIVNTENCNRVEMTYYKDSKKRQVLKRVVDTCTRFE